MAKIHILDRMSPSGNDFNAVTHFPMPLGNNSVGVSWKTCYLASFGARLPTSRLTVVGNGAGQITQDELNQITSGDLIEVWFAFSDDPDQPAQVQKNAIMDDLSQRAINEFTTNFVNRFRYYGFTRP